MQICTLENEFLLVKFRNQGGELIELFDKTTQTHRLKRGDKYWSYYAPILFPIVGRSFNDTIRFHDKPYKMEKHGFLRKSLMDVLEHKNDSIIFHLKSNSETLKIYPFEFEIKVLYKLMDKGLVILYAIHNNDKDNLYFQIGSHPAFNLNAFDDIHLEDHYIEFSKPEQNVRHLINSEGYFTGETETIPIENQKLFLKDSFFEKDAIILKKIQSNNIYLKNTKNEHGIRLDLMPTHDLKYFHLGIWKPVGADFVCIEPWIGCADTIHFQGNFSEKDTFNYIKPGQFELFIYKIEVF